MLNNKVQSYIVRLYYDGSNGKNIRPVHEKIDSRDPSKVVDDGEAIGFYFYDVVILNDDPASEVRGIDTNYSGKFYYGEKFTYDDLANKNDANSKEVARRMKATDTDVVCRTRNGLWFPLEDGARLYSDVCELARQKK